MILTTSELIASLRHETHILRHLTTKLEPSMLDYRPTPGQRSTIELLRYLVMMGPTVIRMVKAGGFDVAAWSEREAEVAALTFDQVVAALDAQGDEYAALLGHLSDEEARAEIMMFGRSASRGALIVNIVLCGHAAYRTQLFNYLKACGRHELSTMNLWAGADAPARVAAGEAS